MPVPEAAALVGEGLFMACCARLGLASLAGKRDFRDLARFIPDEEADPHVR